MRRPTKNEQGKILLVCWQLDVSTTKEFEGNVHLDAVNTIRKEKNARMYVRILPTGLCARDTYVAYVIKRT